MLWTKSSSTELYSARLPVSNTSLHGSQFSHLSRGNNNSKAVFALPSSHEGLWEDANVKHSAM